MTATIKFLILYSIPIFSVAGTFAVYMVGYGKSADTLIKISFLMAVLGLIISFYITVVLMYQFLADKINYLGVVFSLLGCFFEITAFSFYIIMFKDEV